jgi:hypothetical protein
VIHGYSLYSSTFHQEDEELHRVVVSMPLFGAPDKFNMAMGAVTEK